MSDQQDLKLTEEEHQALLRIRFEVQQMFQNLGELELHKTRILRIHLQSYEEKRAQILAHLENLDKQGQDQINNVSLRLGISEGQSWHALNDGSIRLVQAPTSGHTEEDGASSS